VTAIQWTHQEGYKGETWNPIAAYHLETGKRGIKQLGKRPHENGVTLKLADSHGGNPEEWPADLRIREFPTITKAVA
jgi:hypothetical protein